LKQISDTAALKLAQHQGCIELKGLTDLAQSAADGLAQIQEGLILDGLLDISIETAKALSRHNGLLSLGGIRDLTEELALALSAHKGCMSFAGLCRISDEATFAITHTESELLFEGLENITADAAWYLLQQGKSTFRLDHDYIAENKFVISKLFAKHREEFKDLSKKELQGIVDAPITRDASLVDCHEAQFRKVSANVLLREMARALEAVTAPEAEATTPSLKPIPIGFAKLAPHELHRLANTNPTDESVVAAGPDAVKRVEVTRDFARRQLAELNNPARLMGFSGEHSDKVQEVQKTADDLGYKGDVILGHSDTEPLVVKAGTPEKGGNKQFSIYRDGNGNRSIVITRKGMKDHAATLGDAVAAFNAGKTSEAATASEIVPEKELESCDALIPAGSFEMGDSLDGVAAALPAHAVQVSAFYMAKYLVTKGLWDDVRTWGLTHGYPDLVMGRGKARDQPAVSITWHDTVKWCNARSEKGGLTPCYTLDGSVYRTTYHNAVVCNWNANGYRLPTEAEWEKAARGGLVAQRFPWGDTISHANANFLGSWRESYATDTGSYDPSWRRDTGSKPYTSPGGAYPANGYGIFDMAGNVWEWCWDWYDAAYYGSSPASDPTGPNIGSGRVVRGGSWNNNSNNCRVAHRHNGSPAGLTYINLGFRVTRSSIT